MEEEFEQQLQIVEEELQQVRVQISDLLEQQEKLNCQKSELQSLLKACRLSTGHAQNAGNVAAEGHPDYWAGSFEWDQQANDIRLNVFGISTYRVNQREIINAVMSGRDVVVIMAAGGGKSLCYQLPAFLRPGTALVVSPLLSLIQDQVMGLTALNIPAGMLTSTTSKENEKSIYKALEKGEGELKVLYVTPEKISKKKWRKTLNKVFPAVVVLRTTCTRAFDTKVESNSNNTSFIVDKTRRIILTNRRVVNPGPIVVDTTFLNREEIPIYPLYGDHVHDFGFLRFDPASL